MKLALALLLLPTLASVDCAQCTADCTSSVTGTGTMSGDVGAATDTTVCIGSACSTQPITFDASKNAVATYTGSVTGSLTITPAGAITLAVLGKTNGFNDGDVYGLLVNQGAAGTLLAKTSAPITYTRVTVCGDTCMQSTFTF